MEAFPPVNRQPFQTVVIARDDVSVCRASRGAVCAVSIRVPRHRRFTTQGRAIAADHPPHRHRKSNGGS